MRTAFSQPGHTPSTVSWKNSSFFGWYHPQWHVRIIHTLGMSHFCENHVFISQCLSKYTCNKAGHHMVVSETKGPHHIHSLRSSCFIKKSAFNVAANLVMVVKFTFQSVFGNSLQNPRHFSPWGREESLELYSILWSDWPTSKQEVLSHGNRFVTRVSRRYFSKGEKRRPEMRLRFAGYSLERLNLSMGYSIVTLKLLSAFE